MENFWEQRCHQPMDHRHENPAKTQNSPFLACQTDTDFFNDNSSSSTNNENASIAGSYPAALSPATTRERFLRVGDYFSLAQWQELELQALIYKYMIAGASVPLELILPIKRSLMNSSYSHRHHQHSQTAMLQEVGYLGRSNDVDPEPGRCRRTDGKKWRCSKEAKTGRKYCDRHVHRSRARKQQQQQQQQQHLVESTPETPKATTTNVLNLRIHEVPGETGGGQVQRQFFDDWPRSSTSSQHQI